MGGIYQFDVKNYSSINSTHIGTDTGWCAGCRYYQVRKGQFNGKNTTIYTRLETLSTFFFYMCRKVTRTYVEPLVSFFLGIVVINIIMSGPR